MSLTPPNWKPLLSYLYKSAGVVVLGGGVLLVSQSLFTGINQLFDLIAN